MLRTREECKEDIAVVQHRNVPPKSGSIQREVSPATTDVRDLDPTDRALLRPVFFHEGVSKVLLLKGEKDLC